MPSRMSFDRISCDPSGDRVEEKRRGGERRKERKRERERDRERAIEGGKDGGRTRSGEGGRLDQETSGARGHPKLLAYIFYHVLIEQMLSSKAG